LRFPLHIADLNTKKLHRFLWVVLWVTPFALGASYILGKTLRSMLINSLNEELNVRVEVFDIRFTGIESLPYIGLELRQIRIHESFKAYGKPVINAGSVKIKVNPFSLFTETKSIRHVEISNATIRIFDGATGNTNYEIFKPSSGDDQRFNVELKKIKLKNTRIIYQNESEHLNFNYLAYELKAKGQFSEEKFHLYSESNGLFDHIQNYSNSFLVGKHTYTELEMDVDNVNHRIEITKGTLGLESLRTKLTGEINSFNSDPTLNLKLEAEDAQIQGLLALLPNKQRYGLQNWTSSGNANLHASITGNLTEDALPTIDMGLELDAFEIKSQNSQITFEIEQAKILSNNKDSGRWALSTNAIDASSSKSNFHLKAQSADLEEYLKIEESACSVDLEEAIALTGSLNEDVKIKGLLKTNLSGVIKWKDIPGTGLLGDVALEDFSIKGSSYPNIHHCVLNADLHNNQLRNLKIQTYINDNNLALEGILSNLASFWADGRPSFKGQIDGSMLNLDDLLLPTEDANEVLEPALDLGIDLELDMSLASFKWADLLSKNVRGKFVWTKDQILLNHTNFAAWNGQHSMDLILSADESYYQLNIKSTSNNLDLSLMLKEFHNFHQTEITHEHLKGNADIALDLQLKFNPEFILIQREVMTLADVRIRNGKLNQYKPLEKLSLFVELEELRSISFEDMSNVIEIRNGIIYIPETELKNNALNLTVSGTHTLENYLEYDLSIELGALMAAKSKWMSKKREQKIEEGEDGGLTAYIIMKGTPDDLVFRYDSKKAVKGAFQKIKTERKAFFKEVGKEIRGERTLQDRNKAKWEE
jgi:hypothetical protein